MRDLSAEGAVIHEQDIEVLCIVDYKLLQSVRKEEFGGIVRAISDFRHLLIASEPSSHPVVNAYITTSLPLGLLQLSANLPP